MNQAMNEFILMNQSIKMNQNDRVDSIPFDYEAC